MKKIKLKKIIKNSNDGKRYDIQVANTENFFGNGILVHNSWCSMGSHPDVDVPIVTSKGLSSKGLAFKFNEANVNNLYIRAFKATVDEETGIDIIDKLCTALNIERSDTPVYIMGEIFGTGIQDLAYDCGTPQFRIFDIFVGNPKTGKYLDPDEMRQAVVEIGHTQVPILYAGPFFKDEIPFHTDGMETISGKEKHIREGIVIKPMTGRSHDEIGRVFLKSVSDAYLLRKGNVTEYN